MRRFRVVTTDCTDPYVNLAVEEHLTMNAEEGVLTLFLWQNACAVVIGKNQNPWRECDVEAIKRDGISLARRMSGGGAVYHDLGNLNFTFIAKDGLFDVERQTNVILLACRLLGINAVKTGRNDLTVSGKKFSGHAYYSSHGYNYHHGTLMIDVKEDDLSKYLRVPESKLKSKGVASVRSRVTNLIDHIPAEKLAGICSERGFSGSPSAESKRAAAVDAMSEALIRAMLREYGCEAVITEIIQTPDLNGRCPAVDFGVPQTLIDKYASEEWRLGTKIPFTNTIEHRFEWGGVEIQLDMKGGCISDCRIYSDSLETEVFGVIERLIKGRRYDSAEIRALRSELPEGTSATAYEILGLIAKSV